MHREIGRIIDPHRGDAPAHQDERWRMALTGSALFTAAARAELQNAQLLDADGLVDRVTSTSFIAALSRDAHDAVERALRDLAVRHGGRLRLPYRTEIELFVRVEADPG